MKRSIRSILALIVIAGLSWGCRPGAGIETVSEQFNQLPQAVQTTVRATAPDAEIIAIDRRTDEGIEVYEITLREGEQRPTIGVTAEGDVIRSDLPQGGPGLLDRAITGIMGVGAVGTKFSALPMKVQAAIQEHAPQAEITRIRREERDGFVTYEVEFRDREQFPPLRVAEDGSVVSPEHR